MPTERRMLSGRYEILDPIGSGGMGRVFRATDHVLGRSVAVKILAPHLGSDPRFVERFRREAHAAARLSHPNVVSVFDLGEDEDTRFIVMELLEGRTLQEVLHDEGSLPVRRAVDIAVAVAEALGVAHEQGIVHRDVKPANVMLTRTGGVKVMDFGIARALGDHALTETAATLGTAAYLSPEQAAGGRAGPRSDLYALGVLLFEMLTGRPPFAGGSPVAVALQHVQRAPERPSSIAPSIPPAVEAVVLRCLAKDPEDRPSSASDMAASLSAALETDPPGEGGTASAAPGTTERLSAPPTMPLPVHGTPEALPPVRAGGGGPSPRPRWPWLILLAVVLVLALVVGMVLFARDAFRAEPPRGLPTVSVSSPIPTPSPSPSSSPSPSPSPSPLGGAAVVSQAVDALRSAIDDGVGQGEVSEKAAKDLDHKVDEAEKEYAKDHLDRALEKLDEVDAKTDEAVEKGEISSEDRAALIHERTDDVRSAMQATAGG